MFIPQLGGIFRFGSNPTPDAKPGWVTRPDEVHPAGDVMLLDGQRLGGERLCPLSISLQKGLLVRVLHGTS